MDKVDEIKTQWNRARPDLDVAPMGLIGRLVRLSNHLSSHMEQTFAQHGLNFASFDVLATLRRSGAPYQLSPGELLSTMMVTSGTMTNRIDQLAKAGLVMRKANPDDARSVKIALTEKGFGVIDAAVTAHVAKQVKLTECLSEREFAELNSLLSKYLSEFES